MRTKRASFIAFLLLLVSIFGFTIVILPEGVTATTLYVGGPGPGNYTTIQGAIDASSSGDTIFVFNGTYNESVVVDKTLNLIGEGNDTRVIGQGLSTDAIHVSANWVNVTGFTLNNSASGIDDAALDLYYADNCYMANISVNSTRYSILLRYSSHNTIINSFVSTIYSVGIRLYYSNYNTIINNSIMRPTSGISLWYSENNTIVNNNIIWDWSYGLRLYDSHQNSIMNNTFTKAVGGPFRSAISVSISVGITIINNTMIESGITISGGPLEHWNTHTIDTANTVNGKPVYYWNDILGGTVPSDAGQVILVNCRNVIVENQNVSNTSIGVQLAFSTKILVSNNTASDNSDGIVLHSSHNNSITHNNASDSVGGIYLTDSNNNEISDNDVFSNNRSGIRLSRSHNCTIDNNKASFDDEFGIYILYSSNSVVKNNIASFNGPKPAQPTGGIYLFYADNTTITNNTATDNRYGIFVFRSAEGDISDNTVSNNWHGLSIEFSGPNVSNNTVSENYVGMYFLYCGFNTINNNTLLDNEYYGIDLERSDNFTISNNIMLGNGIAIWGPWLHNWTTHTIDTSNTVNAKPVLYLKNTAGGTVQPGAGQIILANCTNVIVENQDLSNASVGIQLGHSDSNRISDNVASDGTVGIVLFASVDNILVDNVANSNIDNGIHLIASDRNLVGNTIVHSNKGRGIYLVWADGNTIINNALSDNGRGLYLEYSNDNLITDNTIISSTDYGIYSFVSGNNGIYHNNFINNTVEGYDWLISGTPNQWDNGYPSGGNYWSNYTGIDQMSGPGQNIPGPDGIGDSPYVFQRNVEDRYPLISPLGLFPRPPIVLQATLGGTGFENVTIGWAPSLDDGQGLDTVVGYEIYRNTTHNPQGSGYGLIASIPKGRTEFTDSYVGEGDPSNYFYMVCALDLVGNKSCSKYQAGKFTRFLMEGLNMVSIPLIQSDEDIRTVLQTVAFNKSWSYDSTSQEWKSLMKSKPYLGDLESLSHRTGLWVNAIRASNLTVAGVVPIQTSISLRAGWNLVAFPSFDANYSVSDLNSTLLLDRIEGFDASSPPYHLRVLQDSEFLQAGHGYWIEVSADTIWIVQNN